MRSESVPTHVLDKICKDIQGDVPTEHHSFFGVFKLDTANPRTPVSKSESHLPRQQNFDAHMNLIPTVVMNTDLSQSAGQTSSQVKLSPERFIPWEQLHVELSIPYLPFLVDQVNFARFARDHSSNGTNVDIPALFKEHAQAISRNVPFCEYIKDSSPALKCMKLSPSDQCLKPSLEDGFENPGGKSYKELLVDARKIAELAGVYVEFDLWDKFKAHQARHRLTVLTASRLMQYNTDRPSAREKKALGLDSKDKSTYCALISKAIKDGWEELRKVQKARERDDVVRVDERGQLEAVARALERFTENADVAPGTCLGCGGKGAVTRNGILPQPYSNMIQWCDECLTCVYEDGFINVEQLQYWMQPLPTCLRWGFAPLFHIVRHANQAYTTKVDADRITAMYFGLTWSQLRGNVDMAPPLNKQSMENIIAAQARFEACAWVVWQARCQYVTAEQGATDDFGMTPNDYSALGLSRTTMRMIAEDLEIDVHCSEWVRKMFDLAAKFHDDNELQGKTIGLPWYHATVVDIWDRYLTDEKRLITHTKLTQSFNLAVIPEITAFASLTKPWGAAFCTLREAGTLCWHIHGCKIASLEKLNKTVREQNLTTYVAAAAATIQGIKLYKTSIFLQIWFDWFRAAHDASSSHTEQCTRQYQANKLPQNFINIMMENFRCPARQANFSFRKCLTPTLSKSTSLGFAMLRKPSGVTPKCPKNIT